MFKLKSAWIYWIILISLIIFVALTGVYLYINNIFSPVNPDSENAIMIEVPKGAHSNRVASILEEKGLIKSERAFIYYLKLTGTSSDIKAGKYELSPSHSLTKIIELLLEGPRPDDVVFTIPEGYTFEQITGMLKQKGLIDDTEKFKQLAAEGEFPYAFAGELSEGPKRLEGYLFPDTYHISESASGKEIINTMLARFEEVMKEINLKERAADMGLSVDEVVTIASMVEREAKVDHERARIAGVILNRLESGRLLQIDATIQYALEEHRPKLYHKDLEVDSPYNTYKNDGLPPGPIGSPGRSSLEAVLEPEDTEYLYYVAKPDGTHAFAKTLEEHNRNVRKYQ